jgi:hypothetical protein
MATKPAVISTVIENEFQAIRPKAVARPADDPPLKSFEDAAAEVGGNALPTSDDVPGSGVIDDPQNLQRIYAIAHRLELSALCLSGGGIRSASLALGVIQGLAENGLLERFDYLSTVSGGGYIGSWLSAWIARSKDLSLVVKALKPQRTRPDEEPHPIRHLRAYSSYLTPKVGLVSADTWAAVAIIVRNILLNWLILVPAIFLPVVAVKFSGSIAHTAVFFREAHGSDLAGWISPAIAIAWVLLTAMSFAHKLRKLYSGDNSENAAREQAAFLVRSLLPAVASGACFAWLANCEGSPALPLYRLFIGPADQLSECGGLIAMIVLALVTYTCAIVTTWACAHWRQRKLLWCGKDVLSWMAAAVVSGVLVWLGAWVYGAKTVSPDRQIWLVIFGMPWFLLSMLAGQIIYVMLRSYSKKGDFEREWLGRAGGWNVIGAIGWMALSALVLLASVWYEKRAQVGADLHVWLTAVGGLSGSITAFLGKSSATPGAGPARDWTGVAANVGLAIAGPIFGAVLLMLLSLLFDDLTLDDHFHASAIFIASNVQTPYYWDDWRDGVGAAFGAVLLMLVADYFVNVNRFSLHAVYRNRLVRAFLGASRLDRKPDGFTSFDLRDNPRMTAMWKKDRGSTRLFHVVNMTLNLASTSKLSWQQRKAESFTVTPQSCGAARLGYRDTAEYGDRKGGGISLGTAMAISGAAVSPNMGYHSSPSIAFLLTLFDVRLGWWLGNPGRAGGIPKQPDSRAAASGNDYPYERDAPMFSLRPLFAEWFGLTNDDSPYVYLSDGGHFEDLGLYEMVRRRCRWIVLSDGGEDAERGFEDLGNAARKIWIDLGVRITFPRSGLLAADATTKPSKVPYYALGRIEYLSEQKDGKPEIGNILYLKATVRGTEEAADIIAYARAHSEFPNQSTGDQWFDEPQLEAYRALGYLMMRDITAVIGIKPPLNFKGLFSALDTIDPVTMGAQPMSWV